MRDSQIEVGGSAAAPSRSGTRPLARSLGLLGVLFLTLSVATPASSVFVIAPDMLRVAGTGTVWALILATIVCVATAYIYAELSSAWPVAGGEYVMVERTLGPLAGFVMLGVNVFNNLIFLPVAGLGISEVLGSVLPGLPQVPTAVVVVGGCALLGILDVRVNAVVTGAFLMLEVVALTTVAALGWAHPAHAPFAFLLHPVAVANGTLAPASFTAIGVATSIAIFALNGYGAAVYFAEEMKEAPQKIARTVLWAVAATLLLEGAPIVGTLVGATDLHALFTAANPFGLLVTERGSATLEDWISVGVAVAIVNAIIAWVLACARFFYGTARDGSWGRPIDGWLTMIHPRFASPWVGTLIIGAVGIALCFLPRRLLEVWSGAGLIVIYAGIALAVMVGRARGQTADAPFRMPLYPLAPVVTFVALGYIVVTNWLDPDDGRPALVATAIQMVLSVLYYWLILRRRGAWVVHDPAEPGA